MIKKFKKIMYKKKEITKGAVCYTISNFHGDYKCFKTLEECKKFIDENPDYCVDKEY